ncbi:amidohydrolase [Devosia sp. 2618]|uniref:amidohydrolase n=1 Tax=Devosia sp. 2618 TaxID=3156454 RepID=UPI00339A0991
MLLKNARLPDGRLVDLLLDGEQILRVDEPGRVEESDDVYDLETALVSPAFIDGHIHLDKTYFGCPPVPHQEGVSVKERVAIERVERHKLPLPVRERASALLKHLLKNGTTRVRSHVDIDSDIGLKHLEALVDVRATFADYIDIEIVAFPQSGITSEPGMPDLLDAALRSGADLIGGLDPLGFDGEVKEHLDVIFSLAEKHGKGIDIHLHDGGENGGNELRDIARRTIAAGMEGRVVVSHAFALGMLAASSFATTSDLLAKAGVSIMTSSPAPVPVPPIRRLQNAGVNVFAASDNIRDCWSPFGNGDMLDRVGIVAQRQEMLTNEDLQRAFDLATFSAAKALGITRYGLDVGCASDLVVLVAPNIEQAVIGGAQPRKMVIRRGKLVAVSGELTSIP